MALQLTLPPDLDARLAGLGDAIAAACPDVAFADLFGSTAIGTRTPRSDVDLAIVVAPGADGHAARLLAAHVAARHLSADAVDIVLLNTAPLSLAVRVLRSGLTDVERFRDAVTPL